MLGLKRNTVIGLKLYWGGTGLGPGSVSSSSPPGRQLLAAGKEATARREVGGGEDGTVPPDPLFTAQEYI